MENEGFAMGFGWGFIVALVMFWLIRHHNRKMATRGSRSMASKPANTDTHNAVTGLVPETHAQPTGI